MKFIYSFIQQLPTTYYIQHKILANCTVLDWDGSGFKSWLYYILASCHYASLWSESHSVVSNSLWPHRLYSPWNSPSHNTGVGSLSLLQGVIPTQGSNPGLLHCRQFLYQLSHKGSPRILLQQIFPTQESAGVSCISGGFCTNWAIREDRLQ